jgi:hypothetical protein
MRVQPERIIGVALLTIAGLISLFSFWRIGSETRDALVLTGYVTQIGPGQQRSFGYGGEQENEKVDIAFQGREMSNVSFIISRDSEGRYQIRGQDDDILLHRTLYPPTQQAELGDQDSFETLGPLGRAAFTVEINEEKLRLRLKTPIFCELHSSPTRLVIGWRNQPIPAAIDEIFLRTPAFSRASVKNFRISSNNGVLHIEREQDLSKPQVAATTSASTLQPDESADAGAQDTILDNSQAYDLKHGGTLTLGTIELSFRQYAANPSNFAGLSQIKAWGLHIFLATLFVGLAFIVGPQVRWTFGPLMIFGCVALFVIIGLVLTARDFFFYPHSQRFDEYWTMLYWSALILFALRVPFGPNEIISKRKLLLQLVLSLLCFIVARFLMRHSFDGREATFLSSLLAALWVGAAFLISLFVSGMTQAIAQVSLTNISASAWTVERFRFWILTPLVLFVLGLLITRFIFGGREALMLAGIRIHLPTFMLPVMVLWASVLVWAAETSARGRETWLLLALFATSLVVLDYRLSSQDNGGSAVLATGVLSALWVGSRKKGIPLLATVVIGVGGAILAWLNQSPRFELAWGGEEGQILFYDSAKNLRLARDMARNGGFFGQSVNLSIPAEMQSNIHNDLITAYVIGYFGWILFAVLFLAYALFYLNMFSGIYKSPFSALGNAATTQHVQSGPRSILLIFGGALILTFALQALWVMLATLVSLIPFTGLDLQPISSSAIAVLSFCIVLLGSVALIHTLNQTLPE